VNAGCCAAAASAVSSRGNALTSETKPTAMTSTRPSATGLFSSCMASLGTRRDSALIGRDDAAPEMRKMATTAT
jgi:hypothetical protein